SLDSLESLRPEPRPADRAASRGPPEQTAGRGPACAALPSSRQRPRSYRGCDLAWQPSAPPDDATDTPDICAWVAGVGRLVSPRIASSRVARHREPRGKKGRGSGISASATEKGRSPTPCAPPSDAARALPATCSRAVREMPGYPKLEGRTGRRS